LPEEIEKWHNVWLSKGYDVVSPVIFNSQEYPFHYEKVHSEFCKDLEIADIHFVANENNKGEDGYIGIGVFTELAYRVCRNITSEKRSEIILLKMPSGDSKFYQEINRWRELNWLKVFSENDE
jgi:hypothetical protein